ncbi:MAG: PepSY-like domain-containing protein [Bacteroidota bacterium]|nr:PepSY-like domain-containing protein [Bacteroidota bacterium]
MPHKNIVLFGLLLVCSELLHAQAPAAVKSAFQQQFNTARQVRWTKEKNDFEASFVLNGKKLSAVYDAQGTWKASEEAQPLSMLPAPAKQYLAKNYPGSRVTETAKISLRDGHTEYEAEAAGYDIFFDSKGNFLRAEKDED